MSDEVDAALLLIGKRIADATDPLVLADLVAKVGALALDRLGFPVTGSADAKINIGTDDAPGSAQIILTWPLPPEYGPRRNGAG